MDNSWFAGKYVKSDILVRQVFTLNSGDKLQAAIHWRLSSALCCHLSLSKEEIRC